MVAITRASLGRGAGGRAAVLLLTATPLLLSCRIDYDLLPSGTALDGAVDASADAAADGSPGDGSTLDGGMVDAEADADGDARIEDSSVGDSGVGDSGVGGSGVEDSAVDASDIGPTCTTPPCPVSVSAGHNHACAVYDDGRVACWGRNDFGQIGVDLAMLDSPTPRWVPTSPGRRFVEVLAGAWHTCARSEEGLVRCWGGGSEGQLGDGVSGTDVAPHNVPTPVTALLPGPATAMEVGADHSCAMVAGVPHCWGFNAYGQVTPGAGPFVLSPVAVSWLPPTRSMGTLWVSTCALLEDGMVRCYGDNPSGEMGDGSSGVVPVGEVGALVFGIDAVDELSAGGHEVGFTGSHACVRRAGALHCWGRNDFGQLGDGTTEARHTPVVTALEPGAVVEVDAGALHTCALVLPGSVHCWGQNAHGQLGRGSVTALEAMPTAVPDLDDAVMVSAGEHLSCALRETQQIVCWGENSSGGVGDGTRTLRSSPTLVLAPD